MKMMSMKAHVMLLGSIAALLLFQWSHMREFDAEKPNRILHLIEDLSQLDTKVEQGIMLIYSRNIFDYDSITADVDQMQGVLDELSAEIASETLFHEELEALKRSAEIQRSGTNEFKASFAIFSSSADYLPTLISQLQKERPELAGWLIQLNSDIFLWRLYPENQEAHDRIIKASGQFESLELKQLSRHVQLILDYAPRVAQAMNTVVNCGTSENAHLLSAAYERHLMTSVQRNQRDQVLLIVLGAVLLIYLFFVLYFRQRDAIRLAESENRFHVLFDLIPHGVGVHRNAHWIYCNPALVKMYGAQTEAELIGTAVVERVHPDNREEETERIKLERDELKPAPLMLQKNLRLDGSEFFGEVQGIPFIENGKPVSMTMIRDVSDRVEAEKKTRQLIAAVENTAEAIVVSDRESTIQYANPAFERLTGYGTSEAIGSDIRLLRAGDPEVYDAMVARVNSGQTWVGELPLRTKDGEVIVAERSIAAICDGSGHVVNYVTAMRDVTEEKRRNEQMEHTQRLESLGILAGGIAHDFNNILTAVMGNAALAGRNMDDASPAKDFLARIETSTQRASDLCKQMLAYSGKGRFVVKSIYLSELVEEMTRLMEVSIEKNVAIKYHLADNLPAVEADAAQLQQVILNLITNANEAIESKSGVISFTTGVMYADKSYLSQTITEAKLPEGRYVFIEVSDTGCGMDAAVMKKIFDPFFTTKFTGRGLGMSAVLGIVRGHQGAMRVYSEVGRGTTFKVLLPASEHSFVLRKDQDVDEGNWRASGTVLVVDDEDTIREVATMMLEDMGFKTLSAGDGAEALHVYRAHESEVVGVLLDMTMPKMDGKECFRELRRINPDVKVLLSSGYNEQDATNRFVGQGLAGFLQKPYTPEDLREKLRGMLVDQAK